MTLFEKIIELSKEVDRNWTSRSVFEPICISFPVPKNHARFSTIRSYSLNVLRLSRFPFLDNSLVIVDKTIVADLRKGNEHCTYVSLHPTENKLKTLDCLNKLIKSWEGKKFKRIIAIGGGIILNIAGYIAEHFHIDLILVPTTVISMSDSSIGGKVRVNEIRRDRFIKHAYRSFYEPSQIILDPEFLRSLSDDQIRTGLAEIIKHALYQSNGLSKYLLSKEFQPFDDSRSLLKAILWTADLKRVCLEVDPNESKDGSSLILRAAHKISDHLEEESKLTISHGKAVLKAMSDDLRKCPRKLDQLKRLFSKLEIVV